MHSLSVLPPPQMSLPITIFQVADTGNTTLGRPQGLLPSTRTFVLMFCTKSMISSCTNIVVDHFIISAMEATPPVPLMQFLAIPLCSAERSHGFLIVAKVMRCHPLGLVCDASIANSLSRMCLLFVTSNAHRRTRHAHCNGKDGIGKSDTMN